MLSILKPSGSFQITQYSGQIYNIHIRESIFSIINYFKSTQRSNTLSDEANAVFVSLKKINTD